MGFCIFSVSGIHWGSWNVVPVGKRGLQIHIQGRVSESMVYSWQLNTWGIYVHLPAQLSIGMETVEKVYKLNIFICFSIYCFISYYLLHVKYVIIKCKSLPQRK